MTQGNGLNGLNSLNGLNGLDCMNSLDSLNGLKGQQWSAQGSALGKREAKPSPCKGKRAVAGRRPAVTLLPLQGGGSPLVYTQGAALGWPLLPLRGVLMQKYTYHY